MGPRGVAKPRFPAGETDERVSLVFRYRDGYLGGERSLRPIECPSWAEVAANYPPGTAVDLARLMEGFRPAHGGKLILWHGRPGTGKTTALRALAREWRDWCRVEVVTDPEALLGRAAYLMEALLESGDDEAEDHRPWRLLVLEDTGELLAADAKVHEGQRMSRLLNTVDGLIGHGLRVLLLVTTNEPVDSLHPAVGRPGRCAASIEFATFTRAGAAAWLSARGCDAAAARDGMTLADLFAIAEGFAVRSERAQGLGFRRE